MKPIEVIQRCLLELETYRQSVGVNPTHILISDQTAFVLQQGGVKLEKVEKALGVKIIVAQMPSSVCIAHAREVVFI
jgi:cell division protein FtsL